MNGTNINKKAAWPSFVSHCHTQIWKDIPCSARKINLIFPPLCSVYRCTKLDLKPKNIAQEYKTRTPMTCT